jgi:hypothetical protein
MVQKELLLKGPLVAEIKAGASFQSYKEGIMTDEVAQHMYEAAHKDEGLVIPQVGHVEFVQLKDPL